MIPIIFVTLHRVLRCPPHRGLGKISGSFAEQVMVQFDVDGSEPVDNGLDDAIAAAMIASTRYFNLDQFLDQFLNQILEQSISSGRCRTNLTPRRHQASQLLTPAPGIW